MKHPTFRFLRCFLSGAPLFCLSIPLLGAEPAKSAKPPPSPPQPWVTVGADGRLVYRADKLGNRVPDFSMVGYGTGIVPLPVVPVEITLEPAGGDQTARLQSALDRLAKMPLDPATGYRGALLLRRGEYPLKGTLHLRASGIVLRGEGDDLKTGTVIRDTGTDKDPLIRIAGTGKPVLAETRRVTDAYVPVGSRTLHLDNVAGLAVGDTVMVVRGSNEAWLKFIGADRPGVDWPVTFPIVKSDRVIVAIRGDAVQLDAPITTAIEPRFGGATLAKYTWPGRIERVGVEHLFGFSNHTNPKDEDHAWRFIEIANAQHVFVQRITGQHFAYAAVNIRAGAKWVTVQDAKCLDPVSVITGARRYSFCNDGQLSLVRRCYARHGRHDFVANDYVVTGPNVFVDCRAEASYSELGPHRHWTSGMLFDNIVTNDRISLYHRKNYGRTKDAKPPYHLGHGWAAANCVAWNCMVAKLLLVESPPGAHNWAIGCKAGAFSFSGPERGAKKGAGEFDSNNQPSTIRSLYEAQLAERRRRQP